MIPHPSPLPGEREQANGGSRLAEAPEWPLAEGLEPGSLAGLTKPVGQWTGLTLGRPPPEGR